MRFGVHIGKARMPLAVVASTWAICFCHWPGRRIVWPRLLDDGAAGRLAEPAHQRILQLRTVAAAGLDQAGAELAQYIAERENLLLGRPDRRDVHALRVEMALVARHRQPQCPGLHAA